MVTEKFENSWEKFIDSRTENVEMSTACTDEKLKTTTEEVKVLMKEISEALGEKSHLVFRLEEAITQASVITDRAIYKLGFRDGIKLLK